MRRFSLTFKPCSVSEHDPDHESDEDKESITRKRKREPDDPTDSLALLTTVQPIWFIEEKDEKADGPSRFNYIQCDATSLSEQDTLIRAQQRKLVLKGKKRLNLSEQERFSICGQKMISQSYIRLIYHDLIESMTQLIDLGDEMYRILDHKEGKCKGVSGTEEFKLINQTHRVLASGLPCGHRFTILLKDAFTHPILYLVKNCEVYRYLALTLEKHISSELDKLLLSDDPKDPDFSNIQKDSHLFNGSGNLSRDKLDGEDDIILCKGLLTDKFVSSDLIKGFYDVAPWTLNDAVERLIHQPNNLHRFLSVLVEKRNGVIPTRVLTAPVIRALHRQRMLHPGMFQLMIESASFSRLTEELIFCRHIDTDHMLREGVAEVNLLNSRHDADKVLRCILHWSFRRRRIIEILLLHLYKEVSNPKQKRYDWMFTPELLKMIADIAMPLPSLKSMGKIRQ